MLKKLLLISFFIVINVIGSDLVIVIMIKDEEAVIEKTLQPFLDAGVKKFLVFDTGSTDNTVDVVKNVFHHYQLQEAYIEQEPFINFAASRNRAIELAEEHFVDDCFIFMPDAEWYVQGVEGLILFCQEHKDDLDTSFLVNIKNSFGTFSFYHQRLFRAHRGVRFVGVVHETLNRVSVTKVPDTTYILWAPSDAGWEKSHRRFLRDKELLLQEVYKNPHDGRTVFYLAQTYECLGEFSEAAHWYKVRCSMMGWDEETFMAWYRLGNVYQRLGDEGEMVSAYLAAYNKRPSRIESLVELAQYYWNKGKYALSYMFAYMACRVSYPVNDRLFIEKYKYDYQRYDVLGCAAWYVGEWKSGKWAVEQAMKYLPDAPHLVNNLNLYKSVLSSRS